MATCSHIDTIADVSPSDDGCHECLETGGQWVHLRMCELCGHVGCCDNSPNQHATAHFRTTGHPVINSFEPGEDWFYDYRSGEFFEGPKLPPPHAHPASQTVPGPAGRVPAGWQTALHS